MGKGLSQISVKKVTEASIVATQFNVERAIAEAFDPGDVVRAYDMATACRLLARQVGSSKAIQNRSAAIHTKAVRKIGEVTQRMREEGALAKHGQKRRDVTSGDNSGKMSSDVTSRLSLDDLGISRNIAAAGVKLLAVTEDDIDAMADEATQSHGDFSCKKAVAEVRKRTADPVEKPPRELCVEAAEAFRMVYARYVDRLDRAARAYVAERLDSIAELLREEDGRNGS